MNSHTYIYDNIINVYTYIENVLRVHTIFFESKMSFKCGFSFLDLSGKLWLKICLYG